MLPVLRAQGVCVHCCILRAFQEHMMVPLFLFPKRPPEVRGLRRDGWASRTALGRKPAQETWGRGQEGSLTHVAGGSSAGGGPSWCSDARVLATRRESCESKPGAHLPSAPGEASGFCPFSLLHPTPPTEAWESFILVQCSSAICLNTRGANVYWLQSISTLTWAP